MKRQNVPRAILPLALLLAGAAACSGDDAAAEDPPPTEDPTTEAAPTTEASATEAATTTAAGTDALFPDGIRDVRYCEVLLLSEEAGAFTAEVYNTLGLSDCPQEDWEALDGAAIAAERGAVVALLNGPRFWTLDTIVLLEERSDVETTFGAIPMFLAATVDLGEELPSQTPYTERAVARETIFRYDAGTEVHQLTAPDGERYVMQSYSHTVDATQTLASLADRGDRLDLPDGWAFETRTLHRQLDLLSTDGVATVVQDDLQNTYQRIDPGVDE